MPTVDQRLEWANKRVKFAWAQYFRARAQQRDEDLGQRRTIIRTITSTTDAIPPHIKKEFQEMADALKKKWDCPVCFDTKDINDLTITNCGHFYCKPCLVQWKEACKAQGKDKWECGMCRKKHPFKDED